MADSVIDSNKQNAHGTKKKKEAFTIDFGNDCKSSLQESFIKFKKARQKEIAKQKKVKRARLKRQKNPKFQDELRKKFINQAKKYFGVPYARKYWTKDTEEYKCKLFLDCCGLVRQIVRDLSKDFGFIIGPWNQAYMYDTLPHSIKEQEMKPGDLVFMSGTYVNPKSTNQKHFMTHVEIWLGDGPKTIGARWNNGKVQIWDHYQFNAKSFANTVYHFKSIDTWLKGICKSYCPEHKWKRSKFKPGKKSVFRQDKEKKDKDKQTQSTDEQMNDQAEQGDEPADEVIDEPDDDPDNQVDEDQDQDELEDDDEASDEDESADLDDEDDCIPMYVSSNMEEGTCSSKSLVSLSKNSSGGDLHEPVDSKQGIDHSKQVPDTGKQDNLEQSETSLLHNLDGEKNDFDGEKEMKAGCDKSGNAIGTDNEYFVENEKDELSVQFSTTSIHKSDTSKNISQGGN